MDTLETFISSIPEPIATAILTATFTSIIVFFLQKRIEDKFARSLFEHQTKFERHHEKAVETLEGLYQSIVVICDRYEQTLEGCINFYKNNMEFITTLDLRRLGLNEKDLKFLQKKSNDFLSYFNNNRLYLSPKIVNKIKIIHQRTDALIQLMPYYLDLLSAFDNTSPQYMLTLSNAVETLDFTSRTIEDVWDFVELLYEFVDEMKRQPEKLEYLYKSVADIQ